MDSKYFMHRIKCENGTYDKGIEVHDTFDSAKASYHAYLGAYAYGNKKFPNVTYVSCMITDMYNYIVNGLSENWIKAEEQEEPEEQE